MPAQERGKRARYLSRQSRKSIKAISNKVYAPLRGKQGDKRRLRSRMSKEGTFLMKISSTLHHSLFLVTSIFISCFQKFRHSFQYPLEGKNTRHAFRRQTNYRQTCTAQIADSAGMCSAVAGGALLGDPAFESATAHAAVQPASHEGCGPQP